MIANFAKEHDLIIVSDEMYEKLIYDGEKHISIASISQDAYERTIVINGLSKSYAMTGWRIGYMISSEEIINISKYINDGITYSAPTICQEGSIEALKIRKEISSKLKGVYNDRIKYAFSRVNKIDNIDVKSPQGCIYLFIKISICLLASVNSSSNISGYCIYVFICSLTSSISFFIISNSLFSILSPLTFKF